jgi:hypothetical protein
MRKAHNSQVAASCHLRIAFDMWWLYYHKACIHQVWPCPEKDMRLIRARVSPVVRIQTGAPTEFGPHKNAAGPRKKPRDPALQKQCVIGTLRVVTTSL